MRPHLALVATAVLAGCSDPPKPASTMPLIAYATGATNVSCVLPAAPAPAGQTYMCVVGPDGRGVATLTAGWTTAPAAPRKALLKSETPQPPQGREP
jgi:hypothetical protein